METTYQEIMIASHNEIMKTTTELAERIIEWDIVRRTFNDRLYESGWALLNIPTNGNAYDIGSYRWTLMDKSDTQRIPFESLREAFDAALDKIIEYEVNRAR